MHRKDEYIYIYICIYIILNPRMYQERYDYLSSPLHSPSRLTILHGRSYGMISDARLRIRWFLPTGTVWGDSSPLPVVRTTRHYFFYICPKPLPIPRKSVSLSRFLFFNRRFFARSHARMHARSRAWLDVRYK
jgi:hypothetical protein